MNWPVLLIGIGIGFCIACSLILIFAMLKAASEADDMNEAIYRNHQ